MHTLKSSKISIAGVIIHSNPARIAPGSSDGTTGIEGAAGEGAAGGAATGMLTNCSFTNSFNLHHIYLLHP